MMKLALGTAQFGMPYGVANRTGMVDQGAAAAILAIADAAGMSVLDTAPAYGGSQFVLGQVGTAGWRVVSKLPGIPIDCHDVRAWSMDTVHESIRTLRTDRLYGLLLHRPEDLLGEHGVELADAMHEMRRLGMVDKIGVSIYAPDILDGLVHRMQVDLVQAPFNVLDRRLLETGWLRRLADAGVEVHARSVFLQGLLLASPDALPQRFQKWSSIWSRWRAWLEEQGLGAAEACLGFALSFPEVHQVIVGVDGPTHMRHLLHAFEAVRARAMPALPDLSCHDLDLIDPSRWGRA